MKKIIAIITLLIFTLTIFNSCSKFEEGPSLSLKSKKARLANTWQIETIYDSNGTEYLFSDILLNDTLVSMMEFYGITITSLKYEFSKDETMNLIIGASYYGLPSTDVKLAGVWEFVEDTELQVTISANETFGMPETTDKYNILRLSSSEFWLEYAEVGDAFEFHLIPEE